LRIQRAGALLKANINLVFGYNGLIASDLKALTGFGNKIVENIGQPHFNLKFLEITPNFQPIEMRIYKLIELLLFRSNEFALIFW
jgi:hypothetical protein